MSHLLDTNICVAHFRRPAGLAHRFFQYGGGFFIPTIVLAELYTGAYHVKNPATLLANIADLSAMFMFCPLITHVPRNLTNYAADSCNRASPYHRSI